MQLTDTTESNSQFYGNDESSLSIFWSQQWQTFPLKVSLCSCGDGVGSFYQQQQPTKSRANISNAAIIYSVTYPVERSVDIY